MCIYIALPSVPYGTPEALYSGCGDDHELQERQVKASIKTRHEVVTVNIINKKDGEEQ